MNYICFKTYQKFTKKARAMQAIAYRFFSSSPTPPKTCAPRSTAISSWINTPHLILKAKVFVGTLAYGVLSSANKVAAQVDPSSTGAAMSEDKPSSSASEAWPWLTGTMVIVFVAVTGAVCVKLKRYLDTQPEGQHMPLLIPPPPGSVGYAVYMDQADSAKARPKPVLSTCEGDTVVTLEPLLPEKLSDKTKALAQEADELAKQTQATTYVASDDFAAASSHELSDFCPKQRWIFSSACCLAHHNRTFSL